MADIRSKEEYYTEFKLNETNKLNEALKYAHDIRKFEIDLYWKRATYFWTFIGATFAGYFALLAGNNKPDSDMLFLLNCLGFAFSLSWFFVNRGSKVWQENWEKHVDMLEDAIVGPLYKTTIKNTVSKWNIVRQRGFSASKINELLSLYICLIWILLSSRMICNIYHWNEPFEGFNIVIFGVITLIFMAVLYRKGLTSGNNESIVFEKRDLPLG
ncbi:hypothetical protein [Sporomusa sphaeroides]|uniref:RipA family octameric membrane protein n=1 Tax=Sporomusa sphaeroides TaxID=47679 RepID=UPI002C493B2E|nr:hypothetical protein [Sporomusa sphaeroides]HML32315.1 hypothetical protein [Sporomusa sphaeroides]